jgi:hypothetical protein
MWWPVQWAGMIHYTGPPFCLTTITCHFPQLLCHMCRLYQYDKQVNSKWQLKVVRLNNDRTGYLSRTISVSLPVERMREGTAPEWIPQSGSVWGLHHRLISEHMSQLPFHSTTDKYATCFELSRDATSGIAHGFPLHTMHIRTCLRGSKGSAMDCITTPSQQLTHHTDLRKCLRHTDPLGTTRRVYMP